MKRQFRLLGALKVIREFNKEVQPGTEVEINRGGGVAVRAKTWGRAGLAPNGDAAVWVDGIESLVSLGDITI